MSSNYDETKGPNANSSERQENANGRERKNSGPKSDFNAEVEFGQQLASMSAEGRKNVEVLVQHGNDRLNRELSDQRRSHSFRVVREENARLKDLLRKPELKLGEIKLDGLSEIKHIEEIAKEAVSQREQGYLDTIKDEIKFSVNREVADDKDRRARDLGSGPSRDDRERDR